jgi:Tol biopolymer transport system component
MAAGRHRTARVCAAFAAFALLAALLAAGAMAAFPGQSGPIVYRKTFVRETENGQTRTTGGLYVHGPRLGGASRQLTFDPGDNRASFSADGRKIVFNSSGSEGGIYVMNSDGSGRRMVVDTPLEATFFPDSRRIVFPHETRGADGIFAIGIDGTGLRRLTAGGYEDRDPTVSPDGRTVAFVRRRHGRKDIFAVSSVGGAARVLIGGPAVDEDPEYAPDGRRIAFTSNRDGCGVGIYVARSDGSRVRRLTPCHRSGSPIYNHPAFSPDGRHIVALRHGGSGNSIVLIRSGGGGIVGTVDRGRTGTELVDSRFLGVNVDIPGWGPAPR